MKSKRLPDSEFAIMQLVWDAAPPVTTAQIMELLGREKGWKIQTVVTLFQRLAERGFLRAEPGRGRERLFYPCISREEYLAMETQSFVAHYHQKSFTSLLNALHREALSDEDLDELDDWVRRARRGE